MSDGEKLQAGPPATGLRSVPIIPISLDQPSPRLVNIFYFMFAVVLPIVCPTGRYFHRTLIIISEKRFCD